MADRPPTPEEAESNLGTPDDPGRRGLAGVLPERVEVWFPTQNDSGVLGVADWFVVYVYIDQAHSTDGTPGRSGEEAGFLGSRLIRSDVAAIYGGLPGGDHDDPGPINVPLEVLGPLPANQGRLKSLALQIAEDYYAWARVSFDRVYNGASEYPGDPFADLDVYATADDSWMRVSSGPWWGAESRELHHGDVATGELLLNAITGSAGIPAMVGTKPGKGGITFQRWSGDDLVAGAAAAAYNVAPTDVGGSKRVIVGNVEGRWQVITEPC